MNPLIPAVAAVIALAGAFYVGRSTSTSSCQVKLNQQAIANSNEVSAAQSRQIERMHSYELQLAAATADSQARRRDLDRIRASRAASGLVCHAAPDSTAAPVPAVPSTAAIRPTADRAFSPAGNFDPSKRVYDELADPADSVVEGCREFFNAWPVPSEPAVPGSR